VNAILEHFSDFEVKRNWSRVEVEFEVCVEKDFTYFLLFDDVAFVFRAFEVVSDKLLAVFKAEVEVFHGEEVSFCFSFLCFSGDDFESAYYFDEAGWLLMEKGLAHVVKVSL